MVKLFVRLRGARTAAPLPAREGPAASGAAPCPLAGERGVQRPRLRRVTVHR